MQLSTMLLMPWINSTPITWNARSAINLAPILSVYLNSGSSGFFIGYVRILILRLFNVVAANPQLNKLRP
jgi:hypothetical protein